jgi:excisionase family DNA binding protein
MALLTIEEAAAFLKVSKSLLYQRKDIPRYRLPGSRAIRFDEAELLAWAKSGSIGDTGVASNGTLSTLDAGGQKIYHRNCLYR